MLWGQGNLHDHQGWGSSGSDESESDEVSDGESDGDYYDDEELIIRNLALSLLDPIDLLNNVSEDSRVGWAMD